MSFSKVLLIVFICGFAANVHALRCGRKLVTVGNHHAEVLRKCGYPAYQHERTEYRSYSINGGNPHSPYGHPNSGGYGYSQTYPVHIEEWTYNFGPRRFMRLLRFENGKLEKITDLGYGHN